MHTIYTINQLGMQELTEFIRTFTVDISGGNQALVDDPRGEVAEMLRAIAKRIESGYDDSGTTRDSNGNTVGSFCLSVDLEESWI